MLRDKLKQLLLKHLIERPSQDEIIRELAQHRIPIKLYNNIILFTLKKIGKPIQSKKPRYLSLKNVNDEEIEKGNESKISDDSVSFGSLFISKDIYTSKENVFSEEEIKNKINHFKNNFKIEEVEKDWLMSSLRDVKSIWLKGLKKRKERMNNKINIFNNL